MASYYFLATLLPSLHIGEKPELGYHELCYFLRDNLSSADYEKVTVIRRFTDIQNIRQFFQGDDLEPYGNIDPLLFEESLITGEGWPPYVVQYLEKYEEPKERLDHFLYLVTRYSQIEIPKLNGFLRRYLKFERDVQLLMTAFRARALGRDLTKELQYEDPKDPLIIQLIAEKEGKSVEPPEPYGDLKPLFEENYHNPLNIHRALYEYRFDWVNREIGEDPFSTNRVLGYLIQLILVEKWLRLDRKKGMKILERLQQEIP